MLRHRDRGTTRAEISENSRVEDRKATQEPKKRSAVDEVEGI
jgi:hypothetical protein